ncbi:MULTISPECIES: ATP synthase F1 subunit epsilon [Atopobiaceae]|uniref:ATP synthase F1 subunit epsilon n=1 Tax=Atopobiaceae TaxID=1643824 RepID=UPI00034E0BD6|nr:MULTISPECIES: ATP synthase F1 subunit epsilon [Atopobiaceae]EPD78869.1 ATP synthase F1, epsilon subunit [Atopobium sp. oral taxon 199 str. F0494]
MAELTCQFVRPDRLLYEGNVASLILATIDGELGVWPGHEPEIVALGDGIVRLHIRRPDGEIAVQKVVISGGYAEIDPSGVIILADHARRTDDINADVVRETRDAAIDKMDALDEKDNRRAYYENKIKWCNLLLKQVLEHSSTQEQ